MTRSSPPLGTTYQSALGAIINSLRSSREPPVKQAELASHLGLTVSTWSRIERGESSITLEQLVGIAVFFKISLSDLFTRVEAVVMQLESQGVDVADSKATLGKGSAVQLTNTQILGMSPPPKDSSDGLKVLGGIAAAALIYGLLKKKE